MSQEVAIECVVKQGGATLAVKDVNSPHTAELAYKAERMRKGQASGEYSSAGSIPKTKSVRKSCAKFHQGELNTVKVSHHYVRFLPWSVCHSPIPARGLTC